MSDNSNIDRAAIPPLRGSDSPLSFAYTSIHTRLAQILRQPASTAAVSELASALQKESVEGRILPLPLLAPESVAILSKDAALAFSEWEQLVQTRIDSGDTFDSVP